MKPADNRDVFKDTPMGKIPQDWDFTTLGSICLKIADCRHKTPDFYDSGVLIARTSNIKEGRFDTSDASYVSEREYESRVLLIKPKMGDIILTREAPVGEAFVVPSGMKFCLGQRTVLLRPDPEKVNSSFLVNQIYSPFVRSQLRRMEAGTTNPHINLEHVRSLLISLPPLAEQNAIAEALDSMDNVIDAHIKVIAKLRSLKTAMSQDLLMGRKRMPN